MTSFLPLQLCLGLGHWCLYSQREALFLFLFTEGRTPTFPGMA